MSHRNQEISHFCQYSTKWSEIKFLTRDSSEVNKICQSLPNWPISARENVWLIPPEACAGQLLKNYTVKTLFLFFFKSDQETRTSSRTASHFLIYFIFQISPQFQPTFKGNAKEPCERKAGLLFLGRLTSTRSARHTSAFTMVF